MTNKATQLTGGLLIVAGHAIWNGKKWVGGFPGEERYYAAHVKAGTVLLEEHGYESLAFTGGRTRPKDEAETSGLSEAEGMWNYAAQQGWLTQGDKRIIIEREARDTMENLLFSQCAFYKQKGRWPTKVGMISWNSKGLRVHLIASGMRLGGRIFFHGVGDYPKQHDLERACAAEVRFLTAIVDPSFVPPSYKLVDPLLRNATEFARKRWERMPTRFTPDADGNMGYMEHVKATYGTHDQVVQILFDQLERLRPGDGWRHIDWPWLHQ